MTKTETTWFQSGVQHHAGGVPRGANPFVVAAYNNGARNPLKYKSVQDWFLGWDTAEAAKLAAEAIAKARKQ